MDLFPSTQDRRLKRLVRTAEQQIGKRGRIHATGLLNWKGEREKDNKIYEDFSCRRAAQIVFLGVKRNKKKKFVVAKNEWKYFIGISEVWRTLTLAFRVRQWATLRELKFTVLLSHPKLWFWIGRYFSVPLSATF